jgi:hypothetical protein
VARRLLLVMILGVFLFTTVGCYSLKHTVGSGGSGMGAVTVARQWYILWGLVPLNHMDSRMLVDSQTKDYTVWTWCSPVDVLMDLLLNIIIPTSITSRTIEVWR